VFYRRLARWSAGRSLYNFTAGSDGRRCFDAPTRTRLAALKQQWDPEDLFRFAVGVQAPNPGR